MPQSVTITVGTQDLNAVKPSITLGATNDLATITVAQTGIARALQHICAVAWEYSSDNTNWYAIPANSAFQLPLVGPNPTADGKFVYYARSSAGGRLDTMVVK